MSQDMVEVQGILQPDGTLVLEEKPNLASGRVRVTLQRLSDSSAKEDWWQCMQRLRAEREAEGAPFMTDEEIQTHIEDLRSGDERIEEVYRQLDEGQQRQE